ncbi:MAG: hypothetical protein HY307_01530 [Arcobacter sp.]|nr:hypothetical protein [Arcobacter sp.]
MKLPVNMGFIRVLESSFKSTKLREELINLIVLNNIKIIKFHKNGTISKNCKIKRFAFIGLI